MNILSRLPFLKSKSTDREAEEAAEIQAKADRIAFHRQKVRNGPVAFKEPTQGQLRRAEERARETRDRKARTQQVKGYFGTQQQAATVRGHLQAAGVLPYAQAEVDEFQQVVSTGWLIQRFGAQLIDDPTRMSFAQHEVRKGLENALIWYGRAVQAPVSFPEDYVVPVYVTDENQATSL